MNLNVFQKLEEKAVEDTEVHTAEDIEDGGFKTAHPEAKTAEEIEQGTTTKAAPAEPEVGL